MSFEKIEWQDGIPNLHVVYVSVAAIPNSLTLFTVDIWFHAHIA